MYWGKAFQSLKGCKTYEESYLLSYQNQVIYNVLITAEKDNSYLYSDYFLLGFETGGSSMLPSTRVQALSKNGLHQGTSNSTSQISTA